MARLLQEDTYVLQIGDLRFPLDGLTAVASVLVILLITLYPYTFEHPADLRDFPHYLEGLGRIGLIGPLVNAPLTALAEQIGSPIVPNITAPRSEFIYAFLNVLLFMPLGFSVASMLRRRGYTWMATFLIVQLLGSGLSLCVETIQTSIPSRSPTVIDFLTNSIGAFLGFLSFQAWKEWNSLRSIWLTPRALVMGFAAYAMLILFPSLYGAYSSHFWGFSNWSSDFFLLIGNEKTGDRPWHGNVSQLSILDRALSDSEVATTFSTQEIDFPVDEGVLAFYRFGNNSSYSDQTGSLPPLIWTPVVPEESEEDLSVGLNHWLQTETPTAYLADRILQTGEFTIDVTFSPANTTQEGPARIVSYSGGSDQRNFTLGQKETDLILRVRSPFTGANASAVEYTVPDVLSANNTYRVVAAYGRDALRIYVNDASLIYTVDFTPETRAVWCMTHLAIGRITIDLRNNAPNFYAALYYAIMLLPIGIFIGVLVWLRKPPYRRSVTS